MRRPLIATTTLALTVALAGCGAQPPRPPDPARVGPPFGRSEVTLPQAGLTFGAPEGWRRTDGPPPQVTMLTTGAATIALWRYPRTESLPADHQALVAVKQALVATITARDPSFAVRRAKLLKVDGKRAVQVLGTGTIEGVRRTIRSTHVYAEGAEVVVDEFAPERDFPRVDDQVFRDFLRSVKIARAAA